MTNLGSQTCCRFRLACSSVCSLLNMEIAYRVVWEAASLMGCHQRNDRSFFIHHRQMPICARCLGVLIGVPCAFVATLPTSSAIFLIACMVVDGSVQAAGLRESSNTVRVLTGIGFSIGLLQLIPRIWSTLWNI